MSINKCPQLVNIVQTKVIAAFVDIIVIIFLCGLLNMHHIINMRRQNDMSERITISAYTIIRIETYLAEDLSSIVVFDPFAIDLNMILITTLNTIVLTWNARQIIGIILSLGKTGQTYSVLLAMSPDDIPYYANRKMSPL